MTTPSNVELGHELRDVEACLGRIPAAATRDGIVLVEWLSEQRSILRRIAKLMAPTGSPVARVMPVAETRFSTGPITVKGRVILVERRKAA